MSADVRAMESVESLRLDKWLWAARFFKTRQLAVEAINGGKVQVEGQRSKPGKTVKVGSRLRIHKGPYEWNVAVKELPRHRRSAAEAKFFYEESAESCGLREQLVEQLRLQQQNAPNSDRQKPTKKQRRQIHRFVGK